MAGPANRERVKSRPSVIVFCAGLMAWQGLPLAQSRYAMLHISDNPGAQIAQYRVSISAALARSPLESSFERAVFAGAGLAGTLLTGEQLRTHNLNDLIRLVDRADIALGAHLLESATWLERVYLPDYIALADLYRQQGRELDGERVLRQGLELAPGSPLLHHMLGLILLRLKRIDDALPELATAAARAPANARYAYAHALALHATGQTSAAISCLELALQTHPKELDILNALVRLHEDRGALAQAWLYAGRLRALSSAPSP